MANEFRYVKDKNNVIHPVTDDTKTEKSVIGTIENDNTASKAYAAGEYFIKDSKFCQAKTAIAQGATFTLNTNYTESDVATELVQRFTEVQAEIDDIKDTIGYDTNVVIGLQIDFDNNTFKRLGGAIGKSAGTDFNAFKMYGGRKRCTVADDGTINHYYGDTGYTEDGSDGQVMVYQPKFYYKVQPLKLTAQSGSSGYLVNKCNYFISEVKQDGFKLHPAFINKDGDEVDYILIGAFEGCLYDVSASAYVTNDAQVMDVATDKFSSIGLAKPASGLTQTLDRVNIEALCQNRGTHWHEQNIQIVSMEQLLMMVEYGQCDFQRVLGKGVVDITDNSGYNCSAITGSTVGNTSGRAASTDVEIGGTTTTYTVDGKTSVSYRGVENFYGNIWKFVMGVNIYGNGSQQMGVPFICTDYAYAESKNTGNYKSVGFMLPASGSYQKYFGYGNEDLDWVFMPAATGGNDTLPIGDYVWGTTNLNGFQIPPLGARWDGGFGAGGFYWRCSRAVGARTRDLGGRLAYVP